MDLLFLATPDRQVGKSYPICPMCYDDPPFGAREEHLSDSHEHLKCVVVDCIFSQQLFYRTFFPRQGKHWNLDHPIYKKYRPAASGLHGTSWYHLEWQQKLAYLALKSEVMSCIADNCPGTLCLDVDSGPKWQIDCNICHFLNGQGEFRCLDAPWKGTGIPMPCEVCNNSLSLRIRRAAANKTTEPVVFWQIPFSVVSFVVPVPWTITFLICWYHLLLYPCESGN